MECADYWKGYNTNGVALSGQPFCQPSSVVTFRDIAIFGHHFGPQHDNLSFLTYYLAVSEVIGRSTRFLTVIRVDWVSFIAQVTVVTPCHHYSSVTATLVRRPLRNEIYRKPVGLVVALIPQRRAFANVLGDGSGAEMVRADQRTNSTSQVSE